MVNKGKFLLMFQDAEAIEKLNESGELRQILKPYKVRKVYDFFTDGTINNFLLIL